MSPLRSGEPVGGRARLFLAMFGLSGHGLFQTKGVFERGIGFCLISRYDVKSDKSSTKCAGGVAERPIAPVLKTGDVERRSRVRISPPPLTRHADSSTGAPGQPKGIFSHGSFRERYVAGGGAVGAGFSSGVIILQLY